MVYRAFLTAIFVTSLGTLPAAAQSAPPTTTAKAWAIADGKTGKVLWTHNDTELRPMASTTKVMTTWIVLQLAAKDPKVLDEVVVVTERAAKTIGSSAKIRTGDKYPVQELLYGLMLPSGNDAAVAFAEHFGSRFPADDPKDDNVKRFVGEMNRQAKALKMKDTTYADPNGLDRNNKTTVRDLVALTWNAMQNKAFRNVVSTRSCTYDVTGADGEKRKAEWKNTNQMLESEGFDGVKTGTTTPAGDCLICSGHQGDDHLIVVVLGSDKGKRYNDTRSLYSWAWQERAKKGGS